MELVPAGTYQLGCTPAQDNCFPIETERTVTLTRDFWVARMEVTQGQYLELTGENPTYFPDCSSDCPADQVTWFDAVAFANAASVREDLDECYAISGEEVDWPEGLSCTGYRLPTEAEWEVAARGGEDTTYSGSNEADPVAWCTLNSEHTTHPVGEKLQNGYGLQDMSGNVYEWAWDWAAYYSDTSTDPIGPDDDEEHWDGRIIRGGSWSDSPDGLRMQRRHDFNPDGAYLQIGFRLVRTAQ